MLHRLAALVAAISLTGCSFLLTSSPPERTTPPSPVPPDCTTQMTWPTIDAIISALSVLTVVGVATGNSSSTREGQEGSAIASSIVLAGLAGAGAYVGYGRVKSCRAATNEFAASFYRNGGQPVPGQPYAVPGVQPTAPYAPQQPTPYVPQGPYAPPPARPLATEGDVCNAEVVCGLGLVCASNICVVPPKKP